MELRRNVGAENERVEKDVVIEMDSNVQKMDGRHPHKLFSLLFLFFLDSTPPFFLPGLRPITHTRSCEPIVHSVLERKCCFLLYLCWMVRW